MKPIYLLALLRLAYVIMFSIVCGCASTKPKLTLAHNIQIPKEWSAGSEDAAFPDFGVAERYVSAYDRGWWIMVQNYARDINFDDPSALAMSGWAEEAYGGQVGYGSARDRIEELIRVYGKQRVSEYLQQFRLPDEILTNAPISETNDWNALAAYKMATVIEPIPHDACATNMLQLALWLKLAIGEGYRFPVSLASLASCTNHPMFSNSLLVCPTTGHVPGAISNAEAWTDYIYVGNGSEGGMCDVALLISPPENHGGEYGYVAWGCGNIGKWPAATIRRLIKEPWCFPAEFRGQPKVRDYDGFDKFVKPTIKISIPARFASIYGTNSAAATRQPASFAEQIRALWPSGWQVSASNDVIVLRRENPVWIMGKVSNPPIMPNENVAAYFQRCGRQIHYEVRLRYVPLLSRTEFEKLQTARQQAVMKLATGAHGKIEYTDRQIELENCQVPQFFTEKNSIFVERWADTDDTNGYRFEPSFIEIYPPEAGLEIEAMVKSLGKVFNDYEPATNKNPPISDRLMVK